MAPLDAVLRLRAQVSGSNDIKRLGNSMQGVQGKVKNLRIAVVGLSTAFKALGTLLVVGGFTRFIQSSIDAADAFGKLSTRTGIAANELQAFVDAGKLADVSQQDLVTGLRAFARTSFEASQGVKTYAEAYDLLGVAVQQTDGSLKASDDLLKEIADKFQTLPNGPEKAAIAMRIFGKSGSQMITLLNGGSESLERFNYNLSDEFAPRAEKFNDTLTEIGIGFNKMRFQLMDRLLPALQTILDEFAKLFETKDDFGSLFSIIEGGLRGIAIVLMATVKLVDRFVKSIATSFGIVSDIIVGGIDGVGPAFQRAQEYYSQFASQIKQDREIFELLRSGVPEAPKGTTPTTRPPSLVRPTPDGDGTGEKVKAYKDNLRGALDPIVEADKAFGQQLIKIADGNMLLQARLEGSEKEETTRQRINSIIDQAGIKDADRVEDARRTLQVLFDQKDALEGQIQKQDELKQAQESAAAKLGNLYSAIGTSIENGIVDSLSAAIDQTKSLRDIAAATLKDISQTILKFAVNQFLGGSFPKIFGSAYGNVFEQNKIVPFARGGVVNQPTIFPMANGMGLMGEAGPEAVMPLRRGRDGRLGVESSGGGIGNIVVNVDASGTQAQGDTAESRQLGEAIGSAVRQEILKQKRPGGLLA